jgi:hypothetical protein
MNINSFPYMYDVEYEISHTYDFDLNVCMDTLNNRLFCTFAHLDNLDNLVNDLTKKYDILYNKIFILHIKSNNEYVITYNIDQGNINTIPDNTILVHRKKEYNVLYTINSLNELIKSLNGGVVDSKFPINWIHYRNSILLTQMGDLKQLNTKIYKIIDL